MTTITANNTPIAPIAPIVISHVLTHFVSSHVLSGLCKIAGYEILRHGTSYSNYESIIQMGANPNHCEKTTKALGWNTEKKFYVFRDSMAEENASALTRYTLPFLKRIGPVIHSNIAYLYKKADNKFRTILDAPIAPLAKALFTPKLKFIYTPEEIDSIFENDPDYGGIAYRTEQTLPPDRIGLIGFSNQVDKKRVWTHIKSNPCRAILGIAQLAIGILLTGVGLGIVT